MFETELGQRLAEAEATLAALRRHEVDAVVGTEQVILLRLRQAEAALRAKEAELELVARTTPLILTRCSRDLRYLYANKAAADLFGLTPEQMIGKRIVDLLGHDAFEMIKPHVERVLSGERVEFEAEIAYTAAGRRWVRVIYMPDRSSEGETIGWVASIVDITDRKGIERALGARVRQQQAVATLGELALRGRDLDDLLQSATAAIADTLEVEYAKVLELLPGGSEVSLRAGVGWKEGLVGRTRVSTGLDSQAGYTLLSDVPVIVVDLRHEKRFTGPPLLFEHGVVSGMSCIIRACDGKPWGVLGAHAARRVDFTRDDVSFLLAVANILGNAIHRQESDQRMRTVMAELNHRVKNTLATVDAMARQTLHSAENLEEFGKSFTARVRSMALAHSLLTRSEWVGTDLRTIISTELNGRLGSPSDLMLEGPPVILDPRSALALHMAMHELATNASKYGSLSVPSGRVRVDWVIRERDAAREDSEASAPGGESIHRRSVEIVWKEQGGPPAQQPCRTGYGSKMIKHLLQYELDGAVESSFEPDGLSCRMTLPLLGHGPAALAFD